MRVLLRTDKTVVKLIIEIREPEVVEFESVAQMDEWLARERDRLQREEIREQLDRSKGVMDSWPEWKRNMLTWWFNG